MRPPPEVIQRFVFDAVQEIDTPAVFAFGAPWFGICTDLDLALAAELGPGCKTSPVDAWPGWKLRFFELTSRQLLVVSAQPGFAGPPGPEKLEVMRHLVSVVIRARRRAHGSEGRSGDAEISEGLSNLRPNVQLFTLTNRVAKRCDITAGPNPPHYVGVRPLLGGVIAGYVNRSFVDLQLSPERAKHFAETMGWKLHKSNSATGTLRITSGELDDPAVMDLVVDLFVVALDKSEAGPSFEGGKASGQQVVEAPVDLCECHGLEKLGGRCDLCD